MRWVLNYKKGIKLKYWIYNFMIIFGGFISSIFTSMILGIVIDKGLNKGDFSIIGPLLLFVVIITIGGKLLSYFGVICIDNFGENYVGNVIKQDCYKKINTLDSSYFKKTSIGELTTMLTSDMWTIRYSICYIVKTFIGIIFRFIGAFIYCICVNPLLTFIVLLPMPIIAVLSNNYVKLSSKYYEKKRKMTSKFNNFIQENIEANRLIKNFGVEEKEIEKFKDENKHLNNYIGKIRYRFIKFYNKVDFFSEMMTLLLMVFGGLFVIKGHLTIGSLVAFSSLLGYLREPFLELGSLIDEWQDFKVSKERVKKLLEEEPKIKDKGTLVLTKGPHEITFSNVGVCFDDDWILKNINFTMKQNETYAFIGPVGSGKSTITKLLLRLLDPSEGVILIDGINIKEYTLSSLRDNFGYVRQTPFLFSDTILNNVCYYDTSLEEEKAYCALRLAKADFVDSLPDKIHTIIGENGVSLSGGEKQRLSLARALAKNPNCLILDDITSALDFETEIEVSKNISFLDYPCTKVIIAQKIFSVRDAKRIFVLEKGRITEEGTHKELIKNKGFYHEIYEIQKGSLGGDINGK